MERQVALRTQQLANTEALKAELHQLQVEILQERTKVTALSEELETPMNVHRSIAILIPFFRNMF